MPIPGYSIAMSSVFALGLLIYECLLLLLVASASW